MMLRVLGLVVLSVTAAFSQAMRIEAGVSLELAKWRAEHYSDVRYKLNLTLEKMSPVLKGTIEIRVKIGEGTLLSPSPQRGEITPIILDWRKLAGHEKDSTISNVTLNGSPARPLSPLGGDGDKSVPAPFESNEHLVFRDGVVSGENVIKLDFTSPILTSGSAITRYVDKEDGAEYIYSHFAPSDASTGFPVFDQPDLKAKFALSVAVEDLDRKVISNETSQVNVLLISPRTPFTRTGIVHSFAETKPISTYVFAFAAGPFEDFKVDWEEKEARRAPGERLSRDYAFDTLLNIGKDLAGRSIIFVRKSQAEKFKSNAAEVFRLTREAVKYLETYFDHKFPFPKYDLVLIPEFPIGVTDGAGVAFLRESSVVLPAKPTTDETAARALAILHATARQWTGEKAMSKQLDQQWLKEALPSLPNNR